MTNSISSSKKQTSKENQSQLIPLLSLSPLVSIRLQQSIPIAMYSPIRYWCFCDMYFICTAATPTICTLHSHTLYTYIPIHFDIITSMTAIVDGTIIFIIVTIMRTEVEMICIPNLFYPTPKNFTIKVKILNTYLRMAFLLR